MPRTLRWLKQHVLRPISDTFTQFGLDDGYLLAAGVAYYVGLSFFPLLLVLIGAIGWFLNATHLGQGAEDKVLAAIAFHISPEASKQAKEVFREFAEGGQGSGAGIIGVAIILFTAGTIFAQFERAFDRIWRFTPPEDMGWVAILKSLLIERLTAFVLMIGVAVLIVATFVATTALQGFRDFLTIYLEVPSAVWTTLQYAITLVLNTLAFGVLYHTMPRARVKWKEAFRGGLIVAIVWEIGRNVLTAYLIGGRYTAFGVVGALIAIQLWAYYAVTVILLGAEYVRVTCAHCSGDAAAELSRRRFWQLMTKMYTRKPGAPATPPVTQPPDPTDSENAGRP